MPEIAEVHRVVHYLRRHLLNRKIKTVHASEDDIVYGKVGCSATAFKKAITGKTVVDVKQQGKYFWLVMNAPPHPLMHLGMTGWVIFSNDDSAYYKKKKLDAEWPPKYWKFQLEADGKPECKVAFIDARRLARIRLIDVPAEEMRKTSPLKENGPDPMVDKDIFTKEWFRKLMQKKKAPVKAMLLNQANISGIGNWVADEVLYNARLHPEQYSNTFAVEEIDRIYDSIMYVCTTACDVLADSTKFPNDWLMRHRWGKGKKADPRLPDGNPITYVTVGGRTSAVVAALQSKTGPVSDGLEVDAVDHEPSDQEQEPGPPLEPVKKSRARNSAAFKPAAAGEKTKSTAKTTKRKRTVDSSAENIEPANTHDHAKGKRRSARTSTSALPETNGTKTMLKAVSQTNGIAKKPKRGVKVKNK